MSVVSWEEMQETANVWSDVAQAHNDMKPMLKRGPKGNYNLLWDLARYSDDMPRTDAVLELLEELFDCWWVGDSVDAQTAYTYAMAGRELRLLTARRDALMTAKETEEARRTRVIAEAQAEKVASRRAARAKLLTAVQ